MPADTQNLLHCSRQVAKTAKLSDRGVCLRHSTRIPYNQFAALAYVRYVENKLLRTGSELKSS